jgi:C1A family cysteine protease
MMKRKTVVIITSCLLLNTFHAAAQLPSSYDARDDGLITSVKDQYHLGSCWAFVGTSLLETGYIRAGLGTAATTDFSEWQMANYAHPQSYNVYAEPYYTEQAGWGGYMSDPAYYAQAQHSSVFVNEADAPYPLTEMQSESDLSSLIPAYQAPAVNRAIVSAYGYQVFGGDSLAANELQGLKTAIQQHGSAGLGMGWDMDAITEVNNKTVYRATGPEGLDGGHAITLVGWDDQVETGGATPGAFIVKNSWDTSWGDDGYFYLSYDSYTGSGSAQAWLDVEDAPELSRIYSTMPALDGSDSAYADSFKKKIDVSQVAANVALDHSDSSSDTLIALGIWGNEGVDLTLELYDGADESATLLYSEIIGLQVTGFQKIDLSEAVDVSALDELWVSYELSDGVVPYFDFLDSSGVDGSYLQYGGQWYAASTTGDFSPTNLYMIPEPSTFSLVLCVGGGLILLRRLRM